jgi:hypothetical protein
MPPDFYAIINLFAVRTKTHAITTSTLLIRAIDFVSNMFLSTPTESN